MVLEAGDVNGDTYVDIILSTQSSLCLLWGGISWNSDHAAVLSLALTGVTLADVNSDGVFEDFGTCTDYKLSVYSSSPARGKFLKNDKF